MVVSSAGKFPMSPACYIAGRGFVRCVVQAKFEMESRSEDSTTQWPMKTKMKFDAEHKIHK
jgi:hypothetical protein